MMRLFVALMLFCLAAPGLLQALSLLAADDPAAELRELWSAASASEGDADAGRLQGFEDRLEERSPVVRWARRFYAPAVDAVLDRGNARVVFGRRNWLFYRQAVDYVTGPAIGSARAARRLELPDVPGDPVAAIVDFHRQLQAAGVELLVVPVPVKPSLYPERLWQGTDPRALPNNPAYDRLAADLTAAGVRLLDLAPALLDAKRRGTQVFLRRDTHWTPEGMVLAAEAVAEEIRGLPLWRDLEAGAAPFDHRQVAFTGTGDLDGMLAYAPWGTRSTRTVLTQVITRRDGQGPRSAESPILLLGDSLTGAFSDPDLGLGQRGGFAEHLAARLGLPIDVIAMPAGGASRGRRALALRPRPLDGKRLVVWQLTQRDLTFAAEGWPLTPLPPPRAAAETEEGAERRFEVLAWLVETTRLPRTMDYADCLIVSRYRRVDGEMPGSGRNTVDDVLAIGWGIRDWRPTPAASFKTEAFYRLVLEPLPDDVDLESTCWLDDVGLTQRPWWIVEVERQ